MVRLILVIIPIFMSINIYSQNSLVQYLSDNSFIIDTSIYNDKFIDQVSSADIVMFGSVHGSSMNQKLDLWLMKSLTLKGYTAIVVELSDSYAYFLNKFLNSGELHYLDYVIGNAYYWGTPQDASKELRSKWIEYRKFLSDLGFLNKINIIGLEERSDIDIVLLKEIIPEFPTGLPIIDSLQQYTTETRYRGSSFKYFDTESIEDGIYEYSDYLPKPKIFQYISRLTTFYKSMPEEVLKSFGENRILAQAEFERITNLDSDRELQIYENFKKYCDPLLEDNNKIYLSYGYSHVLQSSISGRKLLGERIANYYNDKKTVYSIVSELIDSEYLLRKKYKRGKPVRIKDIILNLKEFDGYSTYHSESKTKLQLKGKKMLNKLEYNNQIVGYKLNGIKSPFSSNQYFIKATRKKYNWFTDDGKSTLNYFQFLIRIRNSKANIPYPEY